MAPGSPAQARTGRPRTERATVTDLGAARPRLVLPGGRSVAVDSDAYAAWCADNGVFAVAYPLGTFLVIAERRARGNRYFIARAYHAARRASVYLGRLPTLEQLRSAAAELEAQLRTVEPPVVEPDVAGFVAELLERETDPRRRAVAEALAILVAGAKH